MKIFSTFLLVYVMACLFFLSGCSTLETSNIEPRKINKNIIEQNISSIAIIRESNDIDDIYLEDQTVLDSREEINSNLIYESIPLNDFKEKKTGSLKDSYGTTQAYDIENISEQIVPGTDAEPKTHKDKIIVDVIETNKPIETSGKFEPEPVDAKSVKKNRLIETYEKEIKLNEITLIETVNSKIISDTEIIENEKNINVPEDKKSVIIVDKANEIVDNLIETDKQNDSKSESINSLLDSLILSEKGLAEKTKDIKNKVMKNKKVPVNPEQIMDNLIITETTRENANKIIEVLISSDSLNKKN